MAETLQRRLRIPGMAALGLLALAIYAPALRGGWLWDDNQDLPHNALLRQASPWRSIWISPETLDYYPLKTSLQWLQWNLWHNQTFGYHLTNLGLHWASACLLWRIFAKLGLRCAWVGAALFLVHPVAVESVAWIAELKDCLSMTLVLLTADAAIDFVEHRRAPDYARAFGWFAAACLAKSSVVMFPVLFLLYAWWRRGRVETRDAWAGAPLFALSGTVGVIAVWFQQNRSIGSDGVSIGGIPVRVALAGQTWVRYLWHCVYPIGLEPAYNRWMQGARVWDYWPWAAVTVAAVVLWGRRNSWGRHGALGLGWFSIQLAPVLGLVPISFMRLTWIMDHLAYLALPGLTGLAAAGFGFASARMPARWSGGFAALAVGGVIALAFESRTYAAAFKSEEALWSYALRRDPRSWLAQSNLGVVRLGQGRTAEAEAYFRSALKLHPNNPEAEYRLGVAEASEGRLPEAIRRFEAVLTQRPEDADAHAQLAAALVASDRGAEAVPHFQAAAKQRPYDAAIRASLALALRKLGRDDEARAALQEAVRLDPRLSEARDLLFRPQNGH